MTALIASERLLMLLKLLVVVVSLAAAGCGRTREGAGADPERASLASVSFPNDGVRNDNELIGPFCCTGRTATFVDSDGTIVGYSYFYEFSDGYNIGDNASVAGSLSILVASLSDLADASSPLIMGSIDFDALELHVDATKSVVLGPLRFEVVIEHVDIVELEGQRMFDMGTIAARVDAYAVADH